MPSPSVSSSIVGSTMPAMVDEDDQRLREAHALLVAEGEHLEREGQRDAAGAHLLDRDDAGDDAEVAVVAAGVDDGVDVRTDEQALAAVRPCRPGRAAVRAWCRRHPCARPGRPAHPVADEVGGALVLGRQVEAREAARVVAMIVASASIIASRALAERGGHRSRQHPIFEPEADDAPTCASAVRELPLGRVVDPRREPARMSCLVAPRTAKMNGMPRRSR